MSIMFALGAGGFCMVLPAIILLVLILALRDNPNGGMAILSLVTGILGFTLLPVLGSISAIISGNIALSQMANGVTSNSNEGLARAGRLLGWIGVAIDALGVLGLLFFVPVSSVLMH